MPVIVFAIASVVSLGASAALVTAIERLGARVGASEAALGLLAALAADGPEITAAITALASGQSSVGVGVTLGSNAFNLAALLGLSAVIAGRIHLHRNVIELEGALALFVATVAMLVVVVGLPPMAGLALVVAAFSPYVVVSSLSVEARARLPLRRPWRRWLVLTLREEEAELEPVISPRRGTALDLAVALAATCIVILGSVVMERAATTIGQELGLQDIVVGALVLAAVTSLPNTVAAVTMARHGLGAAALSTAFNSNAINVMVGLLAPAAVVGIRTFSAGELSVVWAYLGLTMLTVVLAWASRGLGRRSGSAIILGYLLFGVVLVRV